MSEEKPDQSQLEALEFLIRADGQGTLDPYVEERLVEFVGARTRLEVRGALGTPSVSESPETVILNCYRLDYEHLPSDVRRRLTWDVVLLKLTENREKFKKAADMQGGGHLFHITEKGEVLFKDRGAEPVMYGWDKAEEEKDREPIRIYGRESELMDRIRQWADIIEIEARVTAEGYELFEDDGNYGFSELMKRAAAANEENQGLFVASDGKDEIRNSVLKNARYAYFSPDVDRVNIAGIDPNRRENYRGAVRLLRV